MTFRVRSKAVSSIQKLNVQTELYDSENVDVLVERNSLMLYIRFRKVFCVRPLALALS